MKISQTEKYIIGTLYRSLERINPVKQYFEVKLTDQVRVAGGAFQNSILADLHTHSIYSDGFHTPDHIVGKAKARGLGAIAITDHLQYIMPSKETNYHTPLHFPSCEKASKKYGIAVIPGMEIFSADGHILALFSTYNPPQSISRIKNNLSAEETIQLIHSSGGIAIAAHVSHGMGLRDNVYSVKGIIDGIEEYNAATGYTAPDLARKLGVAQIAGSDAHTKITIGLAFTTFPRKECLNESGVVSLNKMIECIKQRKTKGHMIPVRAIEGQFNKARWINPIYTAKSIAELLDDESRTVPRRLEMCLVD